MKYIICSVILFAAVSAQLEIEGLGISLDDLVPVTATINVTDFWKHKQQNTRNSQTLQHGIIAVKGTLPYQAIVIQDTSSYCGGVIIKENWVITAAHCVYGFSHVYVLAGIQNVKSASTFQSRFVKNVTIYDSYNTTSFENDLALVELSEPLEPDTWVQTIALADNNTELFVGNWVRTSGFNGEQGIQEITFLHYLDFKLIEKTECKETFGDYLQQTNICAVPQNDRNTCVVDHGSPLVDMKSGKLIGIATFSTSYGCDNQLPVAYTSISPYFAWINKQISTST